MSFEFLLAKDEKGLHRLRFLYLKLYFSDKSLTNLRNEKYEVKEDRQDTVLINCVKSLLKNQETFRGSIEVWSVPNMYKDRISIGTKDAFEHFIIKDKKPDEPYSHLVHIPRSHTISMSIFGASNNQNPERNVFRSTGFFGPGCQLKRTAFTGYWDPPKRASITLPPSYCEE
jgi:hypothetical protein